MSDLNLFLADNEDFKIVTVAFAGSVKPYTYKTMLDVNEGDAVIVDSPSQGLCVVHVTTVTPGQECELHFDYNLKWIVQVIDTTTYEEAKTMERQAIKTLNKLKYARRRKEMLKDVKDAIGDAGVKTIKGLIKL